MMYEGFYHGYVNQISFYVCLCDVDAQKRLVEIEINVTNIVVKEQCISLENKQLDDVQL